MTFVAVLLLGQLPFEPIALRVAAPLALMTETTPPKCPCGAACVCDPCDCAAEQAAGKHEARGDADPTNPPPGTPWHFDPSWGFSVPDGWEPEIVVPNGGVVWRKIAAKTPAPKATYAGPVAKRWPDNGVQPAAVQLPRSDLTIDRRTGNPLNPTMSAPIYANRAPASVRVMPPPLAAPAAAARPVMLDWPNWSLRGEQPQDGWQRMAAPMAACRGGR